MEGRASIRFSAMSIASTSSSAANISSEAKGESEEETATASGTENVESSNSLDEGGEGEEEEEAVDEDPFSEFNFTLPSIESSEKYIELSPIEQARQHRKDFDLKVPKCILKHRDISQLYSTFELIDTKNSGFIGSHGVAMVFAAMGVEPNHSGIVASAIAKVSKHKKGKLTFKEFLQVVRNKVEERDNLDGLRKGFDSMDFNGKKVLTLSELKTAANLLREPLDREEGQEMIREADKDRDGVVNFDDFCKTINKLNIYI